jgi:hypothetical protein
MHSPYIHRQLEVLRTRMHHVPAFKKKKFRVEKVKLLYEQFKRRILPTVQENRKRIVFDKKDTNQLTGEARSKETFSVTKQTINQTITGDSPPAKGNSACQAP